MRRILLLLLACPLVAQQAPPVSILRGELVKWNPAGFFHVAQRNLKIEICTFDSQTYITDRATRVEASSVKTGGAVEAVVDRRDAAAGCKALTIYVTGARADEDDEFRAYRQALSRQRHVLDHILPRGDMELAGVILEHSASRMVLKTRNEGRKEIRFRDDTHFTMDGQAADATMLEVHAKVFVRAGKGIGGHLEAYQVVRGRILMPR